MCTSLEQLRVVAGHLFGFVEHEIAALTFMYMDEEGDLCTLCDATLPDALSRVSGSVSLRLFISSGLGHIQNACKYFLPPSPNYASPCPSLNQARSRRHATLVSGP